MRRKPQALRDRDPLVTSRLKTSQRGLGWDWQKFRLRTLKANAHCVRCWERHEIVTPAVDLHHVIPRSVDMAKRLDPTNVRPLCVECHQIEDKESTR